eukprot:CAMPEP_0179016446 /NCGR_PEP_ID=MMETSP0796-20121207/3320_1 /TAXON_ID=73915 /ORGANISM="Pyrodinium bahamense, Strain pbaha01" /LENGTH=41 /DNA_ID= /DNA_START= /DNA_END= /DNA_ORIENTATION=
MLPTIPSWDHVLKCGDHRVVTVATTGTEHGVGPKGAGLGCL